MREELTVEEVREILNRLDRRYEGLEEIKGHPEPIVTLVFAEKECFSIGVKRLAKNNIIVSAVDTDFKDQKFKVNLTRPDVTTEEVEKTIEKTVTEEKTRLKL